MTGQTVSELEENTDYVQRVERSGKKINNNLISYNVITAPTSKQPIHPSAKPIKDTEVSDPISITFSYAFDFPLVLSLLSPYNKKKQQISDAVLPPHISSPPLLSF